MTKRRTRPPSWQQRALVIIGILVVVSMALSLILPALSSSFF